MDGSLTRVRPNELRDVTALGCSTEGACAWMLSIVFAAHFSAVPDIISVDTQRVTGSDAAIYSVRSDTGVIAVAGGVALVLSSSADKASFLASIPLDVKASEVLIALAQFLSPEDTAVSVSRRMVPFFPSNRCKYASASPSPLSAPVATATLSCSLSYYLGTTM